MVKTAKTVVNKKHEDRVLAGKTAFECTSVDIQTPQTMLLLLASKEHLVLLKALSTLDKYASKLEKNAAVLYEDGILRLLIPLLNHQELFIKRFATKLLSELCFLPQVEEELLQAECILPLMDILEKSEDLVVQEFASSMIAELTKPRPMNEGLHQIISSKKSHILTNFLTSPDPDVQKNCLQIISNLVKDPYDFNMITQNEKFDVKVFCNLMMSEYPKIQNLCLDVLNIITQKRMKNSIPKEFQDVGGVSQIMMVLKNFEWKDLHSKCLDVVGNIYADSELAKPFVGDDLLQILNYMDFINDSHLRKKAVEVISKMTNTPVGRKAMSESGYVPKLVQMVAEQNVGMTDAVCDCLANLAQDYSAFQHMLGCDVVSHLLEVLADPFRGWDTKTAAVNALYQIMQRDQHSCQTVGNSGEMEVFNSILNQYNEDILIQAPIIVSNCITLLANNAELRKKIVTSNLIASLLHCFEEFPEDTTPLKLAACEALTTLLSDSEARNILKSLDGLAVIWSAVTKPLKNNLQLLTSAATFLHLCISKDNMFTIDLLNLNALQWLLSQRSLREECPVWETALDTIFNKFLPIKFAYTGRLELTDVTENDFYITRVPLSREDLEENRFPMLADLLFLKVCPIHTLYYVAKFSDIEILKESEPLTIKESKVLKSKSSKQTVLDKTSVMTFTKTLQSCDPYLHKYLVCLRNILSRNGLASEDTRNDIVIDCGTVRKKALLIGQFVAEQMAGLDPSEKCTKHTLDLHINEIKVEIQNNIVPLGWLRVGLHMERALLFKVLADRVGLPASLVRGPWGRRGWVEVALPLLPPEPRPAYPSHLLRPNHLIDLMSTPVAIYPLGSYEADVYCGLKENTLLK